MKGQEFETGEREFVPRIQWHGRRKQSKSLTCLCPHGVLKVSIPAKGSTSSLFDTVILTTTTTTTATDPFNKPIKAMKH
jgi:hypothetical protein